jgi:recombinational DNA repair protein (RecF pathway)
MSNNAYSGKALVLRVEPHPRGHWLDILTATEGLLRCFAPNHSSHPSATTLPSHPYSPFSSLNCHLNQTHRLGFAEPLWLLTHTQLEHPRLHLRQSWPALQRAGHLCAFVLRLFKPGEQESMVHIYAALEQALNALAEHVFYPYATHIYFYLLKLAGLWPPAAQDLNDEQLQTLTLLSEPHITSKQQAELIALAEFFAQPSG